MKKIILFLIACHLSFVTFARADDFVDVESYDVEISLFQRIADLEQEKVLMRLERDRAQLQLDLDRLAAEQMRLFREQENADARAEAQSAEIERQRLALEQDRSRLEDQRRQMAEDAARRAAEPAEEPRAVRQQAVVEETRQAPSGSIADRYFLREIVGAGNQLVATVEHSGSGRQRRLSVGRDLDGYTVRAISLDEGVEFEKDGEIVTLGIVGFASGFDN